jgi:hypothetical protein
LPNAKTCTDVPEDRVASQALFGLTALRTIVAIGPAAYGVRLFASLAFNQLAM